MLKSKITARILSVCLLAFGYGHEGDAAALSANPSNYRALIATLKPGDTLTLAAGTYPLLPLANVSGTSAAAVTIQGPAAGAPAVISVKPSNPGCCNLIQLENNAYLSLKNLKVDSAGYNAIDGINARGTTHHILVQNCTFVGQNAHQQTNAISTKGVAWNWTLRGNTILKAGTGMYLGNSDGTAPFINGVIEQNYIADTIGYGIQVKWQKPYTLPAGMAAGAHQTIIRDNVLIKSKPQSSLTAGTYNGARPNLLVGGFPNTGQGAQDFYEIYGNFLFDNADGEALFQGSGRVVFHDNLLVGGSRTAATFRDHDLPLRIAYVFNNTIYAKSQGISVLGLPQDSLVTGNAVFANSGVTAPAQKDNMFDYFANAGKYVNAPSLVAGLMDFYPKVGSPLLGTALDMRKFTGHVAYQKDFNGTLKTNFQYRGAYFGQGINPGWKLVRGLKKVP